MNYEHRADVYTRRYGNPFKFSGCYCILSEEKLDKHDLRHRIRQEYFSDIDIRIKNIHICSYTPIKERPYMRNLGSIPILESDLRPARGRSAMADYERYVQEWTERANERVNSRPAIPVDDAAGLPESPWMEDDDIF